MARYAEIDDLYVHGVPRGTLVSQALLVSAVDVSANRLEVGSHALVADAEVVFVVDDGGALPSPLVEGTVYYAQPVDGVDSWLQVSASAGGEAIDLTDEGTAPFRVQVPLTAKANGIIEAVSRMFDNLAVGHAVPFTEPYPTWVTAMVAQRSAVELQRALSLISVEEYRNLADLWFREAQRVAKGAPIRDANATAPANLARGASPTAATGTDDWSVLP